VHCLTTAVITLFAVGGTASCQPQTKPAAKDSRAARQPSSEGEALAETMWENILTSCQVPGSTTPTMFFHRMEYKTHTYEASLFGRETLFEYRSTWKRFYSLPITEADRLNGIQFNGLAIFGARAVRHSYNDKPPSETWSAWEGRTEKIPSPADVLHYGVLQLWDSVMLKVTLSKVNDKWIYYASDVPREDISFDPNNISALKLTCAAASRANPFSYSSRSGETGK